MELVAGARVTSRAYEVTREEVIVFASAYDPQPFHLDDAAAAAHPFFDRLCASGWHSCAIAMRLTVELWREGPGPAPLGGLGIEDLRWSHPVYPGDALSVALELLEVTLGKPRPDMRIARILTRMANQHGVEVMRHTARVIFPAQ